MQSNVSPSVKISSMPPVTATLSGTPNVSLPSSVISSINSDTVNGWIDMDNGSTYCRMPFKFSKYFTSVSEAIQEAFGIIIYYQKTSSTPTAEITWHFYIQKNATTFGHTTFKTKLSSTGEDLLYKSVSSSTNNIEMYS